MATENFDMDYSQNMISKTLLKCMSILSKKGLSKDTVIGISKMKDEPQWMLDFRLRSYEIIYEKTNAKLGCRS